MHDPAVEPPLTAAKALVGARWALGLGLALLAAFTLLAAARLSQRPAVGEEIVQVPVPAATSTPTPTLSAPDPGDNP